MNILVADLCDLATYIFDDCTFFRNRIARS